MLLLSPRLLGGGPLSRQIRLPVLYSLTVHLRAGVSEVVLVEEEDHCSGASIPPLRPSSASREEEEDSQVS